jgi:hypothetical protein
VAVGVPRGTQWRTYRRLRNQANAAKANPLPHRPPAAAAAVELPGRDVRAGWHPGDDHWSGKGNESSRSAPEGFARWSLRLLEEKVVELRIVERASDNTIGRALKKTFSNRIASSNG